MGRFIREERACLDLLEKFLLEVSRSKFLLDLENANGDPEALAKIGKDLGLESEDVERFFGNTTLKDDPEVRKIINAFKSSATPPVKLSAPV